jgi:hypothetical protein
MRERNEAAGRASSYRAATLVRLGVERETVVAVVFIARLTEVVRPVWLGVNANFSRRGLTECWGVLLVLLEVDIAEAAHLSGGVRGP